MLIQWMIKFLLAMEVRILRRFKEKGYLPSTMKDEGAYASAINCNRIVVITQTPEKDLPVLDMV